MACNIMRDTKGKLWIIDRDDCMASRPEKDLWLLGNRKEALSLYQQIIQSYVLDPDAYRYFVYKRAVDDVYEFMTLINKNPNQELIDECIHDTT
jgi:hypothetical protein